MQSSSVFLSSLLHIRWNPLCIALYQRSSCYLYLSFIFITLGFQMQSRKKHAGQSQTSQLVTGIRFRLVLSEFSIFILAFSMRNRHAGITILLFERKGKGVLLSTDNTFLHVLLLQVPKNFMIFAGPAAKEQWATPKEKHWWRRKGKIL